MSGTENSIHLKYKPNFRENLFNCYLCAIRDAAKIIHKPLADLHILDLGCGRGEFLQYAKENGLLNIQGVDFDAKCVEMSSAYAKCHLCDISRVDRIFVGVCFDVILMSHSLEHLENPREVLQKISGLGNYFLLSVPNPLRPNVIQFSLRRRNYSNLGHYYCWDRSHFRVFIEMKCGLSIDKWYVDDVRLINWSFVGWLRKIEFFSHFETKYLPMLLPYFSTSLVVLCH